MKSVVTAGNGTYEFLPACVGNEIKIERIGSGKFGAFQDNESVWEGAGFIYPFFMLVIQHSNLYVFRKLSPFNACHFLSSFKTLMNSMLYFSTSNIESEILDLITSHQGSALKNAFRFERKISSKWQ